MYDFSGKIAVVTGAARGIGYACAEKLAKCGAETVLLGRGLESTQKAADILCTEGYKAYAFACDVSDRESVAQVCAQIIEKFGKVDFLVNNAGLTRDAMFHKMSGEAWDTVVSTNLTGVFNMCAAIVPIMREQRCGCIVNLSSVSALGNIGQANYAATKAGVIGLTRTLAKELGPRNIRVNAIMPGTTNTDIIKTVPDDLKEKMVAAIPMRRIAEPQEQANVIAFLCSEEASYISGQSIAVDGGLTCR